MGRVLGLKMRRVQAHCCCIDIVRQRKSNGAFDQQKPGPKAKSPYVNVTLRVHYRDGNIHRRRRVNDANTLNVAKIDTLRLEYNPFERPRLV